MPLDIKGRLKFYYLSLVDSLKAYPKVQIPQICE